MTPLPIVLLVAVVLSPAQQQGPRPMTADDVVNLLLPTDPQISPDGRRVAFVVRRHDEEADAFNLDLYVTAAPGGGATRLTYHPKQDDHPRWSPDGEWIAFLSDRTGRKQIYLLPLSGGEARQLTYHGTTVNSFQWSPDGDAIFFLAPVPEDDEDKSGVDEPVVVDDEYAYAHLWRVDVATGEASQVSRGAFHITEAAISPDGTRLALIVRESPKIADVMTQELYVLPAAGGTLQRLTSNGYAESSPRWRPDGRQLAYLSESDGNPAAGPQRIHIRVPSGSGEPRVLAPDFDGYIRDYVWSPDGRSLLFHADHRVNRHVYRIAATGGTPTSLSQGDGLHGPFTVDRAGKAMAYLYEDPTSPPDVWWKSAIDAEGRRLTRLNPASAEWLLGRVETVRWRSFDGMEIEGLLVYPTDYEPGRAYPAIVEVHGGPEGAFTRGLLARYSTFPHIYAATGYVTLMPNFRGSSNYGADFAQANKGDVGGGDYQDVMSGMDYLVERGLADPDRLAIKGWSYGGYMSAWAIGHTDRFKVAVYGAGLSNAVSYYGTADIQFSRENLHGGTPYTSQDRWMEMSPLTYVQNVTTPTLIFHGEKDERVPLTQSYEFYLGLKKRGVPAKLVIYPGQPHGLQVPSYQVDKMTRELEWMERYLSGGPGVSNDGR